MQISETIIDRIMLFQWTALGVGQFRLLKKRRPLPDGQLSYELHTANLKGTPVYAVVSYPRTVALKDHPVLVNGRTLMVSKSAYAALKEVADLGEHELIWIDCLSIHESDAEEKMRQEKVLARIYEAADCVYLCQDSDSEHDPKLPAVGSRTIVSLRSSL